MPNEVTVWVTRAGRFSEVDTLFLKKNVVALGWDQIGNLAAIGPNRELFKARYLETYADSKPGAVPLNAGQLFRFIHEMKPDDTVVYPSKRDRLIHIGIIQGEYRYSPSLDSRYPHMRSVKWVKEVPRTSFTQGALYEIGSAMSLFQVKTYADEFLAALAGEIKPIEQTETEDETVAYVVEDIEQTTRD